MPLILAVDRDRRQATQLVSLVHKKLNAELVQASSAQEGLEALAGRVPDLILTSRLLSPKDDSVLAGHLRQLGPLAAHVQTLTIPVLKSTRPRRSNKSVLSKLRRDNGTSSSATEGCDPELFAEEIGLYLARAAEERQLRSARGAAESASLRGGEPPVVTQAEPIEAADPLLQEFAVDARNVETTEIAKPQAIIDEVEVRQPLIETAPSVIVEVKPQEPLKILIEESLSVAPVIDVVTFDEPPTEAPDVAYSAAVEEALAAINEPEATQSEAAIDLDSFASADDGADLPAYAKHSVVLEASPVSAQSQAARAPENEPALPVPIERLVELFADLQPRSIEVMEPPASVTPAAASATPPAAVTPGAAVTPAATVTPAAPPRRKPVLDEDALIEMGEAAWKASFRAAFLKDLGLGSSSSSPEKPPAIEKKEKDKEKEKEATAPQKSHAPEPPKNQDSRSKKKSRGKVKTPAPVQDEWGLFDPEQCGFSALVDKLEKVTDSTEEEQPRRGTRVRVISY